MGDRKCQYNARFVGRKNVEGPLNDFLLSAEVAAFYSSPGGGDTNVTDEIRCQVEFSDKNLVVTFTKKDEGFESDGESFRSVENQKLLASEEKPISSDEKIIADHVFRPSGNNIVEDSFSSNSVGSDSETSDHNKSSSGVSSASITPTAELTKFKFDHLETYNISDVLICHTDRVYKNCVFLVVRKSGSLETIVFELPTEDNAKQLYKKFHEVSKRSRLERHRRRKSDGGSIVSRVTDYTDNVTNNSINIIDKAVDKNQLKWNLVQHTDKNGVTHIEVESKEKSTKTNPNLVNRRDNNHSSNILTFSPQPRPTNHIKRQCQEGSKFAKELESILIMSSSKNTPTTDNNIHHRRPHRPNGEPLSLRQRAPAVLLRKLGEFDDKTNQLWAKAEEENQKIWNKSSNSTIGISSSPGPKLDQHQTNQNFKNFVKAEQKPSKHSGKPEKENNGSSNKNTKKDSKRDQDNNCILIPTKTGKEPPKKLYPKESPALSPVHNRYFPVGPHTPVTMSQLSQMSQPASLPIFPLRMSSGMAWNHVRLPPDMSQLDLSQSVWKFPGAGPSSDTSLWSWPGPGGQAQVLPGGQGGRSRSRDRSRVDMDQRRRAQSKSPARHVSSDISNISKMFRDFGGAVRARMKRTDNKHMAATLTIPDTAEAASLKSNLKKQKSNGVGEENESVNPGMEKGKMVVTSGVDNKKVHFNKFATVQMME